MSSLYHQHYLLGGSGYYVGHSPRMAPNPRTPKGQMYMVTSPDYAPYNYGNYMVYPPPSVSPYMGVSPTIFSGADYSGNTYESNGITNELGVPTKFRSKANLAGSSK